MLDEKRGALFFLSQVVVERVLGCEEVGMRGAWRAVFEHVMNW